MSENKLPLILEPDVLEESLSYDNLLVVDLSKIENYLKMHVPGAVHIDYPRIIVASRPVMAARARLICASASNTGSLSSCRSRL